MRAANENDRPAPVMTLEIKVPQVVWKFQLFIGDMQVLVMPRHAKFLHVAEQHGKIQLWVQADPEEERCQRVILIHGTGHPNIGELEQYIGTVFANGFLVWHVYALPEGVRYGG